MQAQRQPHVRANSTVVIGYCFGGATVLDLAASYPDPITDNVLGKSATTDTVCYNRHGLLENITLALLDLPHINRIRHVLQQDQLL